MNIMITKQTVPFEMAVLAKKLGFPQNYEGSLGPFNAWHPNGMDYSLSSDSRDYEDYVLKIHPMELQHWLRGHGVTVYVVPFDISSAGGWAYNLTYFIRGKLQLEKRQVAEDIFQKFEETLIKGLKHGLELLAEKDDKNKIEAIKQDIQLKEKVLLQHEIEMQDIVQQQKKKQSKIDRLANEIKELEKKLASIAHDGN